ncbi:MAG: hypothetical protein RQ847_02920, partial [Wenzhouxiangellaceae bacterium]|nr:hypothetical protein [Wenzhouxiangellaceae bacterium]
DDSGGDQVAFSDLSATAPVALDNVRVTDDMDVRISNVVFADGRFSFDQTLTNLGSAGTFDGTVFESIVLRILDISEDSVSVANADNGGSGQNGDEARFVYAETLEAGGTSAPRHLVFDDPQAKLFTFDAEITGRVRAAAVPADGSQDPVDTSEASAPPEEFSFTETFSGLVPIGTTGLNLAQGVDHVDVTFTAKASAAAVTGVLSADPSAAGAYPDLDFELLDSNGNLLATSASLGPNETVGAAIEGGESYTYRVVGWANGPTTFRIDSEQSVTDPDDAGSADGGSVTTDGTATQLVRFTVDPLTGSVSADLLD